jgi:hypothetical protein
MQESFQLLKDTFTLTLILVHFDPFKKVKVEINALKFAITRTILQ